MSTINGVYRHEPSDTTLTLVEGDDRTGSFTGTLDASGGQGKWQAADGKEKGEGSWTVKAK